MTLPASHALAFAPGLALPLSTSSSMSSSPCIPLRGVPNSRSAPTRKPRRRTALHLPVAVQQKTPPTTAPSPTPSSPAPSWLLIYLKNNKRLVDAALEASVAGDDARTKKIMSAMRYSLTAGGKRVRPSLAIAAYQMFADSSDLAPVMPVAMAVEMIHTMSLIHDDLPSMDDDDFRRGKPTNHKVFGEDTAILAGDALLSYSFEYVARHTKGVDPQRVVDVITLLGESVGAHGLVGGQMMDLDCEGQPDVSLDTLTWIHTHKTAALLRVSCACGAILGGANGEDVKRVSDFAVKTGLAFQIADDVLDCTASTEVLGKTAGKDEAVVKATYPRLLGLDGSRRQAERLIAEAKECLTPYGKRSETLLALADFIINRTN